MRGAGLACDDTEALFQLLLFIHVCRGQHACNQSAFVTASVLKRDHHLTWNVGSSLHVKSIVVL